jgi:hypothetical protein
VYELIGDLEERPTGDGGLDARRCLEPMRASYRFA